AGPPAPAGPLAVDAARRVPVPSAPPACVLSAEQTQSAAKTYSHERADLS
ncbi:hypothetical protein I6A84_07080, partial [Frankia sp. CNm7]|nr:hypothetical protein [Frankia nepalensis]